MMQEELSGLHWLVLSGAGAFAFVLLGYYFLLFLKLANYKSQLPESGKEPVSIIIAARNEYVNLEKNLKSILEQDYPQFEVIVVNDCSWDESQKLLEYYQEVYTHLKVCKIIEQEKYPTGKKFALTLGIKAAKYEKLLFTDADCMPANKNWLSKMAAGFTQQKQIVLGFSPYKSYPGFLNLFIRFEAAMTAVFYFSAALAKKPFMGVGRNLAYTSSLFFGNKGFAKYQHIMSGDDDLFINQVASPNNVNIQLHADSFMFTEPKRNFKAWADQKTRHINTGKYYKTADKLLLGGYYASLLLFYVSLLFALTLHIQWQLVLGIYLFKTILQWVIFYFVFKKLAQTKLLLFLPILDIFYLFYLYAFGIKDVFTKKRKVW
jgi:glycosyltransferase involved in cell wall biosynthesis